LHPRNHKKQHLFSIDKWLLLAFIFFYCQVQSQVVPKLNTITTDDGLGSRYVHLVAQDKKGLMWISCEKGLERYDGYEFITFNESKNAQVQCAIGQCNKIITSFMDDNTLLVLSNEKLFTIDLCDNSVSPFNIQKKYDGIIRDVYYSKDKSLYIYVDKGDRQLFLRYKKNNFVKISESKSKSQFYNMNQIIEDKFGNIWTSNMDFTLEKYSKDGQLLFQSKLDSFIWDGSQLYFNQIFIDTVENDFYLFPKVKPEIRLYNEETRTYNTIISNLNSPVYNAVIDDRGIIWFATRTQLLKYDKKNKENPFQDYSPLLNEALQFTAIITLFIHEENVLWISTNNGIIKLPLNNQLFDKVLNNDNALWGNEMRGITTTDEDFNLAFCENGETGLYKIDKKTLKPTLYVDEGYLPVLMDGVKHLCYDKNKDIIWTLGGFLNRIDLKAKKTEKIHINNYISLKYRSPIALLNDGNLILGYHLSGIAIFNTTDRKITQLDINKPKTEIIATNFFQEDTDGNIWIGTYKGLFVVDKKGKILQELNEITSLGLSNNYCLSILIDYHDRKWIGTFGGGINIIEKTKNGDYTVKVLDMTSGLCDDNITALLEDEQKNVWASTYNGVSKINADLNTIQNFYVEDGLTHNEFNYSSSMKDEEGKLWFGGLNGITIIDPNKDLKQQINLPVVLTSFSSYDKRTNEVNKVFSGLENNSKFVISPFTSWFQFNWTLPNYYNPAKNNYYVWLEGIDDDYTFHGNTPFIRYNNLPHGAYVLHVKATDSKGNPSLGEISVQIVVLPFFYQTWWFILLCVLAIGALFYALYKYNLNKKLAMERMRTQIASDLHDEVGSMLSGLAMQSELLQVEPNSPNYSKFENIANLSRNVVGKMRDLVWSIDSRSDTIRDLIDKMHEKMATLFGPKDIAYKLDVKDLPLDKTIPVITRQQLFLIFNESITNVVRHSNASEVTVSIYHTKTSFEMVIKDNGAISSDQSTVKSTGFGIRNIHMRAAKIKATIEINKLDGFEVKLNMQKL